MTIVFSFRLREIFAETPFISNEGTKQLAEEMGLTPRVIDTWFKNHRTRLKKVAKVWSEHNTR